MMALKKWSSAQSYEITDLRERIDSLKQVKKEDFKYDQSEILDDINIPTTTPQPLSRNNSIEPMGKYDGLCMNKMVKSNTNKIINDNKIDTYLGLNIPLKLEKTEGGLDGPSIDGDPSSPKKLSILSVINLLKFILPLQFVLLFFVILYLF